MLLYNNHNIKIILVPDTNALLNNNILSKWKFELLLILTVLTELDKLKNDIIVSSFLEVIRNYPNSDVRLVTSDINLQNKMEFDELPFIEPLEKDKNYQLRDEKMNDKD